MSTFGPATAVQRRSEGAYEVELDPDWSIGDKPNGGYLLAVIARAACDAAAAPHPLAVSGHFMRAPASGPAEVRVEVIRQGRRVSTVRAALWQDGRPYVETVVSAGVITPGEPEWSGEPPPDLPPPAECPEWEPPSFPIPLFDRLELRLDPATHPWPPNGDPVLRSWMRLREEADIDPLALLVAVDAMPPTVFNLGRIGWAPTVELTGLVRAVPASGWLRCEARTKAVEGGWFDEEAAVWDSTGRLVAQSRQLALAGGG